MFLRNVERKIRFTSLELRFRIFLSAMRLSQKSSTTTTTKLSFAIVAFVNPLCPSWLIFNTRNAKNSRRTQRFKKNKILFGSEFCFFTFETVSKNKRNHSLDCLCTRPEMDYSSIFLTVTSPLTLCFRINLCSPDGKISFLIR